MLTRHFRGTTEQNNGLTLSDGQLSVDLERKAVRVHDGVTPGGFEMVGVRAYAPPVGPGPEALQAGDIQLGYYGEVTADELITGETLASTIGLSAGTSQNSNAGWLKFAYQGKTLFVAKQVLRRFCDWRDFYLAGAVYGSDDTGLYPQDQNGAITSTLQDARVTVGGDTFKVRLLTGGDTDPSTGGGGEWNDLLYRVHQDDPTGTHWAAFTNDELWVGPSTVGNGEYQYCQESIADTLTKAVIRGGTSLTHYTTSDKDFNNAYRGWRPVLELVV